MERQAILHLQNLDKSTSPRTSTSGGRIETTWITGQHLANYNNNNNNNNNKRNSSDIWKEAEEIVNWQRWIMMMMIIVITIRVLALQMEINNANYLDHDHQWH